MNVGPPFSTLLHLEMPMDDDAISGQCDQPFGREIMEVGTHHFTMYDMDPYMATLFGGEA